jgi:hypothetical protein
VPAFKDISTTLSTYLDKRIYFGNQRTSEIVVLDNNELVYKFQAHEHRLDMIDKI